MRRSGSSGVTPGSTPLASPRATPSDSLYSRGSLDPAEKVWEAEDRAKVRAGGGGNVVEDTPFDWKAAMRQDGREAAYRADGRKQPGAGRRKSHYVDGDEEDEFYDAFYLSEEGVVHGGDVFLGDPEKIREKEEAMKKAQERGEANRRRQQRQNSRKK